MRFWAAEPPGAENPPTLPPAARTLWQGMIRATGFLAMGFAHIARGFRPGAELLCQSAIGRRVAPSDPARRFIDALEEWVRFTEVQLEAGKIGLLALEIALHSGDGLGHLRCGCAGFDAGRTVQQSAFGRFRAFGRQQAIPQKPPAVSKMR